MLLAAAAWAESTAAPAVRIAPPPARALALELPRHATVRQEDASGDTWRLIGDLPVALAVARRDFAASLRRQGWSMVRAIPASTPGQKAELQTWRKGRRKILLMLSEEDPRKCAFSLGET